MSAKIKVSIAIVVSVIGFLLFIGLGMAITFEPPTAIHAARDDDTLSDQLGQLVELVAQLFERVEALEEIWQAQGAPWLPGASCALVQLDPAGRIIMLQRPTMLHHLRQFDTFPVSHKLRHVRNDPESGLTYLVYEIWHNGDAYYALEGWCGCDFEEGTEWIKVSGGIQSRSLQGDSD